MAHVVTVQLFTTIRLGSGPASTPEPRTPGIFGLGPATLDAEGTRFPRVKKSSADRKFVEVPGQCTLESLKQRRIESQRLDPDRCIISPFAGLMNAQTSSSP